MKLLLTISLIALHSICYSEGNDSQEINVYPKTFKIAHYSNSRLQGDKNIFCEGRTDDIALAKNGKNLHFNDYAIDPSQEDGPPKMVALNRIYGATGCTLKFTSGPLAGHTALVGDLNPATDTVAFPINTSRAPNKIECQKIIRSGKWIKSPRVSFELFGDCPGAKGPFGLHQSKESTDQQQSQTAKDP